MEKSDFKELIDRRVSRRAYLDTVIDGDTRRVLQAQVDEINHQSGLAIRLVDDGARAFNGLRKSYGLFSGVRSFFALTGKTEDPHLDEKVGYYGERLILLATAHDLGTCWVGGTFDRRSLDFDLGKGERLVCVITVGVTPEQRTWRENLIRGTMHRKTKSIEELSSWDTRPPEWFMEGMRAVQKAPSAMNRQPARFHFCNNRVTAQVPDSAGFNLVDLGIAKLHFEVGAGGRFAFGNGAEFEKAAD